MTTLTIPVRLGQLRATLKLSSHQAAQAAGVDHRTINRWDAGTQDPYVTPLVAYAARLRTRIVVTRHNLIVCDVQDAVPNLRDLRRVTGATQKHLSQNMGGSRSTTSMFEIRYRKAPAGGRGPTLPALQEYLAGCGYELDLARVPTIGMRLGQLAAEQGVLLKRVAARLDVSQGAVSQWHSGSASMSLQNTVAYAQMVNQRLTASAAGQVVAEGEDLANLRPLRQTAGRTPQQVARQLGVSPDAVRRAERSASPAMNLATCQRYLPASGYQVGLAPAETAVAA